MMTTALNIAVIGAGIAGMSVANLLGRQGHHVTVFERRQPPESQGTGMLLQPVGMDALRALGLLATIESQGTRINRICRVDTASAAAFRLRLRVTPAVDVARRERGALSADALLPPGCDSDQLLQIHRGTR